MTRHLDVEHEVKESKRREELIHIIEYGLAGALAFQGIELSGFSIKYGEFSCFMTTKAFVNGKPCVAFMSSDSIANCLLSTYHTAVRNSLHWTADKYLTE